MRWEGLYTRIWYKTKNEVNFRIFEKENKTSCRQRVLMIYSSYQKTIKFNLFYLKNGFRKKKKHVF